MYIALLGRQPALSVAELEQLYGSAHIAWFSDISATVDNEVFDFERLGGSQKAGRVVADIRGNWRDVSKKLVSEYAAAWSGHDGKITLGISAYGFPISPRDVQKTGLVLKSKLKSHGVSLRLIPNVDTALNTATSHHNKLGLSDNHVELIIVRAASGRVLIAESVGAQNITAIAARDQARPKTDAFVGMLPPKLARMMVNMANSADSSESLPHPKQSAARAQSARSEAVSGETAASGSTRTPTLLDPFCGTGVVLQEASLMGYDVYGTDLSEKMVEYSTVNLEWLRDKYRLNNSVMITPGDAMSYQWQRPIDAVVCETYLGQPFSAPPSPAKLTEVRGNCNHIISEFLRNIGGQLPSGAPLVIAVPAWRDERGQFTHLPLTSNIEKFGFTRISLEHVRDEELLYYRENQVVARELLLLKKA